MSRGETKEGEGAGGQQGGGVGGRCCWSPERAGGRAGGLGGRAGGRANGRAGERVGVWPDGQTGKVGERAGIPGRAGGLTVLPGRMRAKWGGAFLNGGFLNGRGVGKGERRGWVGGGQKNATITQAERGWRIKSMLRAELIVSLPITPALSYLKSLMVCK